MATELSEEKVAEATNHYANLLWYWDLRIFNQFSIGYRLSRLDVQYDLGVISEAIQNEVTASNMTLSQHNIIDALRIIYRTQK